MLLVVFVRRDLETISINFRNDAMHLPVGLFLASELSPLRIRGGSDVRERSVGVHYFPSFGIQLKADSFGSVEALDGAGWTTLRQSSQHLKHLVVRLGLLLLFNLLHSCLNHLNFG